MSNDKIKIIIADEWKVLRNLKAGGHLPFMNYFLQLFWEDVARRYLFQMWKNIQY